MDEEVKAEALITVAVNLCEGRRTGVYTLIVRDRREAEIYRHIIAAPRSEYPVIDYINKKFTANTMRFENPRVTIELATGILTYYVTDKKRIPAVPAGAPPDFFSGIPCNEPIPAEFL